MHNEQIIHGQLVDIPNNAIFPASIHIKNNRIAKIEKVQEAPEVFIIPPFVDAHVHIESSMLVPSEFARLAVVHGTVATISDPHEIGNVLGLTGVRYMINNGKKVPFKFYFGAPSCVPATTFETAGAEITPQDIETLFKEDDLKYLAEMMNWPGVLYKDELVYQKLAIAKKYNKPIDGHAPGLKGEQAKAYAAAGISTDHECFTAEEALDKLKCGMKILIREGSAAKNFEALADLLHEHYEHMMFCSDDKHPDNLVEGHINLLAARAVAKGVDIFKVLKVACLNPVQHYKLEVGQLKEGDLADLILVNNLTDFKVVKTFINGELVAENGKTLISSVENTIVNNFTIGSISEKELSLQADGSKLKVIEALDGQLVTNALEQSVTEKLKTQGADTDQDILKLVVVNRYSKATPAIAFIKNFGLKEGAIASSVAHDSHNIIAVGTNDMALTKAINLVVSSKGGVSAVSNSQEKLLPLPVAGLMSAEDGYKVAEDYQTIDKMAKDMGSTLASPFMTLSFMALLVIPSLKLSDKGLFNGDTFEFTTVFSN